MIKNGCFYTFDNAVWWPTTPVSVCVAHICERDVCLLLPFSPPTKNCRGSVVKCCLGLFPCRPNTLIPKHPLIVRSFGNAFCIVVLPVGHRGSPSSQHVSPAIPVVAAVFFKRRSAAFTLSLMFGAQKIEFPHHSYPFNTSSSPNSII